MNGIASRTSAPPTTPIELRHHNLSIAAPAAQSAARSTGPISA
jgi:hypothetical protein